MTNRNTELGCRLWRNVTAGVDGKSKMEDSNAVQYPDRAQMENFTIEEDAALQVINISRPFRKIIGSHLQKDWQMVDYTLKEYGISCKLDLVKSSMTFTASSTEDPDIIDKAKDLLLLLSLAVPANQAMKILYGRSWEVIKYGCQKDGLCSKFGINKEQFLERQKLLFHPALIVIADMIWCDISLYGSEILVVLGPVKSIKWMQQIVEECMVHKIHPSRRIKYIKENIYAVQRDAASRGFESMKLCC